MREENHVNLFLRLITADTGRHSVLPAREPLPSFDMYPAISQYIQMHTN